MQIPQLLATYPRSRPPLSDAWKAKYKLIYKEGRAGGTPLYRVTQYLESWMHAKVASQGDGMRILEVGAGTLNHVSYERAPTHYDIVEPFTELYADRPELSRIRRIYRDLGDVSPDAVYDRVISIATLEHLTDLPVALAKAALLLGPDGEFRAGIPSEGGFLWAFAWRSTVGLSCRIRYGLDYGELMGHEHVSSAEEIIGLVKYAFRDVHVERFPLPLNHLSLYTAIVAKQPIVTRCTELLGRFDVDHGLAARF